MTKKNEDDIKKESPNYYANIPADVRYSDIPANAKLLYGEITALANKEGYCWASNKYFADLYKKNTATISVWIRALKEKGFIEYEVEDNYKRKIYLKGVLEKSKGGIRKTRRGVLEKSKHNITSNTTNNNTTNNIIAKQSFAGKKINELIELFKEVNPSYKRLFGNKTQREAIKRLLDQYGYEKLSKIIKFLPKIFGREYAPVITTPYQLEAKMAQLVAYTQKEFRNKSNAVKIY